jgi:RNA polymerase sigma factor (sigma-70 family)
MDPSEALAKRAAAGDAAAFAMLVRQHEAAVRRFLGRLADHGADDLAQETFLTAWRRVAAWRGTGSYRGWLLRIAWTTFLGAHRAAGRQQARDQAAFEDSGASGRDPELAIDLSRALAGLDPRDRPAALLCFGEGCSHAEAAEVMGIPLGTLKSIVARARAALVQRLEAQP